MSDAIDWATERLDRQRAALICNGDSAFAPQQNTNLRLRFVRDVIDDVLQQPYARGRMHLYAADIHLWPPPDSFESLKDDDAVRAFVVHLRELPDITHKMDVLSP